MFIFADYGKVSTLIVAVISCRLLGLAQPADAQLECEQDRSRIP